MSLEIPSSGDRPDLERVSGALDDTDCREIITVLGEPRTASEVAEVADLPLSTTYRKLDRLTEAGLATETVGVRQDGHHTSRYVADFDRIGIRLDEDHELRVDIDRTRDRSLGIWSDAAVEF